MNVLSNPIFWLLVGAIVFIMALIGYLAEGTELAKKVSKKPKAKKEDKKTSKAVPDVVPENVTLSNLVQNNENITPPTEAAPSAWSGEIKKEDEKKETTYVVPAADDWSTMPTSDMVPSAPVEPAQTTVVGDKGTDSNKESEEKSSNVDVVPEVEQGSSTLKKLLPREEILHPIDKEKPKESTTDSIWG